MRVPDAARRALWGLRARAVVAIALSVVPLAMMPLADPRADLGSRLLAPVVAYAVIRWFIIFLFEGTSPRRDSPDDPSTEIVATLWSRHRNHGGTGVAVVVLLAAARELRASDGEIVWAMGFAFMLCGVWLIRGARVLVIEPSRATIYDLFGRPLFDEQRPVLAGVDALGRVLITRTDAERWLLAGRPMGGSSVDSLRQWVAQVGLPTASLNYALPASKAWSFGAHAWAPLAIGSLMVHALAPKLALACGFGFGLVTAVVVRRANRLARSERSTSDVTPVAPDVSSRLPAMVAGVVLTWCPFLASALESSTGDAAFARIGIAWILARVGFALTERSLREHLWRAGLPREVEDLWRGLAATQAFRRRVLSAALVVLGCGGVGAVAGRAFAMGSHYAQIALAIYVAVAVVVLVVGLSALLPRDVPLVRMPRWQTLGRTSGSLDVGPSLFVVTTIVALLHSSSGELGQLGLELLVVVLLAMAASWVTVTARAVLLAPDRLRTISLLSDWSSGPRPGGVTYSLDALQRIVAVTNTTRIVLGRGSSDVCAREAQAIVDRLHAAGNVGAPSGFAVGAPSLGWHLANSSWLLLVASHLALHESSRGRWIAGVAFAASAALALWRQHVGIVRFLGDVGRRGWAAFSSQPVRGPVALCVLGGVMIIAPLAVSWLEAMGVVAGAPLQVLVAWLPALLGLHLLEWGSGLIRAGYVVIERSPPYRFHWVARRVVREVEPRSMSFSRHGIKLSDGERLRPVDREGAARFMDWASETDRRGYA